MISYTGAIARVKATPLCAMPFTEPSSCRSHELAIFLSKKRGKIKFKARRGTGAEVGYNGEKYTNKFKAQQKRAKREKKEKKEIGNRTRL